MGRFLIKAAFGKEALIRGRRLFWSDCEMGRCLFETPHLRGIYGKDEDA